jgi:DNA-binding transcriptional MerR regulator
VEDLYMMRIGDFSRLTRVSVKTLRYYDELGLIKPARVDEFTGYRYYDLGQYERLNRVLALRDLGFSLESIAGVLDEGLSAEQLRGMLRLRQADIEQRIGEENGRLARVEAWLSHLETEGDMADYEVMVKRVEPFKVASVRGQVETPQQQGKLWAELGPYLERNNVRRGGNWLAIYHDEEAPAGEWDIEVCIPIAGDLAEGGGVRVHEIEGTETMASVVHHGPWMTVGQAYDALRRWVEDYGYTTDGPFREIGLRDAKPSSAPGEGQDQADPSLIVEVQVPVVKH